MAEQIVRSGGASRCQRTFALLAADVLDHRARIDELEHPGRTQYCLGCEQHARKVAELESQLKTAMSLLIDYQAIANGSTHERATLAAKVSDWLMKRCADGTWRQLQQDETLDNQTAGETAERGTLCT